MRDLEWYMARVVVDDNGCWIWQRALGTNGYGVISYRDPQRTTRVAHRQAYMDLVEDVPRWLVVCHKCDVRSCINPDHLFVGTQLDNVRDMYEKGRNGTNRSDHCRSGEHPMLGDNVYLAPKNGNRQCRACGRARRQREWIEYKAYRDAMKAKALT